MILVTGRGVSGSWQIRGNELGTAIGAHVEPNASKVSEFDLAVVVKRPRSDLVYRLHQVNVPIIWDIVDAWPQPLGNNWDRSQCIGWLKSELRTFRPKAVVAATEAMAIDCDFGLPVLTLPHHARPKQRINPIREKVTTVGYEGGENYLGRWRSWFELECKRRGWKFVVNPPELASLDIVVAVREATGYAARHWKSNVKLANAQGSRTPCVMMRESGYLETASGGERWADTQAEFIAAFDELTDIGARRAAVEQLKEPTLEGATKTYSEWLEPMRRGR